MLGSKDITQAKDREVWYKKDIKILENGGYIDIQFLIGNLKYNDIS